jgi:hypothetical protein
MASKTISFRIFRNDQLVDTRSFAQEVIKLGRLTSSHLRLEDPSLGRMHAVIEVGVDGNVRIIDLGSNGGTRINGPAVEGNAALRSGDVIQIGSYRLEASIADTLAVARSHDAIAPSPVVAARPEAHVDLSKVEEANARVAEIVAVYGRSIVDVAHVGQVRGRTRPAMPLMVLGGVVMASGIGLFGYEVAQPWQEHQAAVAEAHKHHAEAPEAPGLGTGSLGMFLAMFGLVPFLAGNLRRRDVGLDVYTIGESSEANFRVSGASLPDPSASPLVSRNGDAFVLAFTPAMHGTVELGSQHVSLTDLVASGKATLERGAYHYELPTGAKAKVCHGDVAFHVNLVHRGAVVAGRGEVDWPFWGYVGGTATLGTAMYLLMRSLPDDAMAMQLADDEASARFASYFHQADISEQEEPVEVEPETEPSDQKQGGETGKRAGGNEGQMGDKTQRNTNGAYSVKGPANAVPRLARAYDPVAAAQTAGILGVLAAQDKHFLASIDGGAFAVGNADADIWGNVVGIEHAAAYGTGGLGLVGTGRGGGGADGLIGLGTTGLLGHGNGQGGLYHGGDGGTGKTTGFGDREQKKPEPRLGNASVSGDIDKDMIRRIVRAHLNEIRSCYNAGLTRNPSLEGRVLVQFSIIGSGKVANAIVQENTTKDKPVADCIAKAVKRWSFPRVGKGGTALVSYPFLLTAH